MDFNNEKTAKSFIDMIKENMPGIISIKFNKNYVDVNLPEDVTFRYMYSDGEFYLYCGLPTSAAEECS